MLSPYRTGPTLCRREIVGNSRQNYTMLGEIGLIARAGPCRDRNRYSRLNRLRLLPAPPRKRYRSSARLLIMVTQFRTCVELGKYYSRGLLRGSTRGEQVYTRIRRTICEPPNASALPQHRGHKGQIIPFDLSIPFGQSFGVSL